MDPTDNANTHVQILVIRDDIDGAIDVALNEVFSGTVATNLGWRETYTLPHYAAIAADSRIQDAMRRWEDEEASIRASVEAFFTDLQAAR